MFPGTHYTRCMGISILI